MGHYPINYLANIMKEDNPEDFALFKSLLKATKAAIEYRVSEKDVQRVFFDEEKKFLKEHKKL